MIKEKCYKAIQVITWRLKTDIKKQVLFPGYEK